MADVFDFYVYDDRSIQFTLAEPIMLEDKDVTQFRFRIPKSLNGFDMTDWEWWFIFVNPRGTKYTTLLELTDDEDEPETYSVATYTVGYGFSGIVGTVKFSIEALNVSGEEIVNEWHTKTYSTAVIDTLQGLRAVIPEPEGQASTGITEEVKQALLQIARKVAYIDEHGQTYYNNLYDALYAIQAVTVSPTRVGLTTIGATSQLTATTTPAGGNVTWSSSNDSVATVSATGLVTSVAYGSATITASAGNLSATCSVVVTQATCTGITATYTQSGTVYTTDNLDSIKNDLVVTANYAGGTSATIPSTDYTLSGTLTPGTNTITVNYEGLTDTFSVNAVAHGWYYTFNDTILSSGDHDFGFSGVQTYAEGVNGQAYYHHVATEGDLSTDPLGLYALQSADSPTWGSSNFTISGWQKCVEPNRGHLFNAANYVGTTALSWSGATLTIQNANWSVYKEKITKKYCGIRMGMWVLGSHQSAPNITITNAENTNGAVFVTVPPSSFDSTQWHHYALTRSGDTLYYFVDGTLIYTVSLPSGVELYTSNYITVGNFMSENSQNTVSPYPYSAYYDDLYVNVGTAKWTSDFDPYSITY